MIPYKQFKFLLSLTYLCLACFQLPVDLVEAEEEEPVEVDLLDFEVWQRERGYWFGEYTFLNSSGNSNYEASASKTDGQYNYRKYFGFINLQVKGSELKQRNIFLRPALDLGVQDLDEDGTVSINELDAFGFTSTYDYRINLDTKIATPLQNGDITELAPFNYTEGTEKTFTADQSASDNSGNLSGSYFGIPTYTTIIDEHTVLYRVGDSPTIYQNQLTTLPGNGTRVRTAQGFNFATLLPDYASYYRETKFEDDLDGQGVVIKTAKEKFLEKLAEYRELYNVPEANRIADVEDFFNTGLEPKEGEEHHDDHENDKEEAEEEEPVEVDLLDFEVWQRERGYWFGEYTFLNSSGNSNYEASASKTDGQYNYRKYFGFINLQVKGSELKQRNIFLRPALDLGVQDLDEDGTVSINELDAFGFTSTYDYRINLDTKIATPLQNGDITELAPFNYTEGTEKTFTADQSASDNSGNLSGSYFGIPTYTTIIDEHTVLYRVGDSPTIYQNQLTTLPGNGTRVRTAQGFNFATLLPDYASYYRETKFEDDLDGQGVVIKTAKEKFLEKLAEYRELYNVPEANRIADVEDFFNTGLEPKEGDQGTEELLSYAFNGSGYDKNLPRATPDRSDLIIQMTLINDPDLIIIHQHSSDLENWSPLSEGIDYSVVSDVMNGDGTHTLTIRVNGKGGSKLFYRSSVSVND